MNLKKSNLQLSWRRALFLGMVVVMLASCATSVKNTSNDAEASITQFNRFYLAAINTSDIEALTSLTTENHMMISSGGQPMVGKQALVDAMTRAFERFDIEESWRPEQTVVSGELAWQSGTFVVIATPKAGGDPIRASGTFMRVYQRQPDGRWFMVIDTHNSD